MKRAVCLAGLAVFAASLAVFCPTEARAAVPRGVYAGGQDLGGLGTEEAKQKIDGYVSGMSGQTITMEVSGNPVTATAGDLGMTWANETAVEKDMETFQSGDILRRFVRQKRLEKAPVELDLEIQLDGNKIKEFIDRECAPYLREAVDASITRENGAFVVMPSQDGLAVDVDATMAALQTALEQGLSEPIQVEASVTETKPAKTTEMLSEIQDVLGTFSTGFSTGNRSRATNVRVGSGKINGTVLMPGEILSGYEKMNPFTVANGYAAAASYENGKVVDSIGGGVCQISTTLYNAALLAELEIVQRQNHSMIVTYVSPSSDAAIAGTYKDLKISNPYDTPIYVEAYTNGGTLTFTIYGKETRPENRSVKFVSETLARTDPGEPITRVDHSLSPGARVQVQSSHAGLKSRLWKVVYVDGAETERTLLHTDTYAASKAIYRVGPAAPAVTVPDSSGQPPATQEAEAYEPKGPGDPGPASQIGSP